MPYLVFIMAENSQTESAGPHPQGTLLIVRSTRRMWYWDGGWTPAIVP